MAVALQKTFILILLIVIGLGLRSKIKSKTELNGIKEMILSVALPSTVFVALMGVKIDSTLLIYPLITLAFNFFIYLSMPYILTIFKIETDSSIGRTLTMLMPSLAPGLSSFPFIHEFLGKESLAKAAMADVGNKFFALNFLYFVAMSMYFKNNKTNEEKEEGKLKSLLLSLVKEPINIVMLLAIAFLSFGLSFDDLPPVISEIFNRTSTLMTPLVLIYIGLAVQLKEGKIRLVSSILLFRAGITILFSVLIIIIFHITSPVMVLLAVVVPLSSCSFWPFAHMSAVALKEENNQVPKEKRTFNIEFAVLVLAFSLPFSTILVMGILTAGTFFAHIETLIVTGLGLIAVSFVPKYVGKAVRMAKAQVKKVEA
ncbi:AEC family transporter [Emticicia soli]|uniref:Permease n=1 Tax=Emticicia soli TaxID=2027878 RepID=A0ABW5J6L6_9BACT